MAGLDVGRLARRKVTPGGRLILWTVIVLTAAVYAQTLDYSFVYDDPRQIEMSQSRFTWSQAPGYFTSDVWEYMNREAGNYYRPVFLLWLLLNYQLFGLSHPLWHASTVAIHVAAAVLLFFLVRRLTADEVAAGIAALLFGLHPAHVEAVAWVSGVTEPLAGALVFATLLAYLERRAGVAVCLFAAALFAKETAMVVPALIFALEWIFGDGSRTPRKRIEASLRAVLPYLAVGIVYFGFRLTALHRVARPSRWRIREVLFTIPEVICRYVKQLIWPARMALFPDLAPVAKPDWSHFALPALAVAAILLAAIAVARRSRVAAFACFLTALPLLPVLDLAAFSRQDFFHDRYLYLPSAGACLLAALAIRRIAADRALWVALPFAGILAVLTVRESVYWNTNTALAARGIEIAPGSREARQFYVADLVLNERFADALPLLEESSIAHPEDPDVIYAIGICRYRLDEWQEAATAMRQVLAMKPSHPHAQLVLGMAEEQLGRLDEAEADMRQAIRIRPRASEQYRGYHATLAALLEKKGDLKGALEEYEAELKESPDAGDISDHAAQLRARIADRRPH